MQTQQRPAPTPGSNNGYRQQLNRDIENLRSRSRRQFLATASWAAVGTAALVGGAALLDRVGSAGPAGGNTACNNGTGALSASNPVTLKVCQLNGSINFFAFYVAQQNGYLKANGLNIPPPPKLQVGPKLIDAVTKGEYDLANGVITDAFTWSRVDSQARVIGSFMNGYVVDVVASKKFQQEMHVSPTSPLEDKIRALRGKTIAITGKGTGTQALLTYLFRLIGLDASKETTQVSLGSNNAAALQHLKAGSVDALSFFSPIGQTAEAEGTGNIYISPVRGDIPSLTGDVHGLIYARQSTIDSKPQAIAAYIRAVAQAETFIQNNPDQAKVLLKSYLGYSADIANAVYLANQSAIAKTPVITEQEYNTAGQFHVKAGLVTLIPSYTKLVATETIQAALSGNTASCPS